MDFFVKKLTLSPAALLIVNDHVLSKKTRIADNTSKKRQLRNNLILYLKIWTTSNNQRASTNV